MRVYIDGAAGTTGLMLEERLSKLKDIALIKPDSHLRKDIETRRRLLNQADAAFLCLPDEAAREAVSMIENPHVVVIDASTAHRTADGWAYGFPELSPEHTMAIRKANRIAVPGCHASGFAALVYPLVKAGFIDRNEILSCHSLTGYSGGGKQMIAQYEDTADSQIPTAAKLYALGLHHKHLPEMQKVCALNHPPIFTPIIAAVRQGMVVSVPLAVNARELWSCLSEHYRNAGRVQVQPFMACDSLEMEGMNGSDDMEIYVFGNESQALLSARFDNLGKGSSGAAVDCLKLRMA